MSDTPLTDAAKEGGESWMELAALSARLERENYLLKVNLGVHSCQLEECKTALEKAERENAEMLAKVKSSSGWDDYSAIKELQRENAELKIERNRYKVALEDIALANDQWPGYKAREVLGKEAQP